MNKIAIIISIMFLIPTTFLAQDKEIKKLFNQYKNTPGFELKIEDANIDIDGDFDIFEFLDVVEAFYILNFDGNEGSYNDLHSFKSKFDKLIHKKGFKSMIDISGDGAVRILTKKVNDKTTDFLLITEGEEEAMFLWACGR